MKYKFTYFLLLFCLLAQAQDGYTDRSTEAGINLTADNESIAVGDFNNDGYDDFFVCNTVSENALYRNNGDATFTEITATAGILADADIYTQAAVWGDLNNDGFVDLYVGNKSEADRLYLNNGNETFSEISFAAGIYQQGFPKSVNMADVNGDGFLDVYISNFATENVLYLNNGDLTFTNYTFAAGALDSGQAMGTIFFDYDKDGDADLYLVHDGNNPNFLYQNDGTGSFTEVGAATEANTASFGMGVDVGDVNHDGWLDIYIANLWANILLLNNGNGTFTEISESAAVDDGGMGWGTFFLDFDNDGHEDIYVANGNTISAAPNVLYRNAGDSTFEKAETDNSVCSTENSYGAAHFDYDLDGNTDILVANRNAEAGVKLYKNAERAGSWVTLKLVGTTSNRDAVGAKISLLDNTGVLHYHEVTAGSSWSSQSTLMQHIGLGEATAVESLTVEWTTGEEETFALPALNQHYTITEGGTAESGLNYGGTTGIFNPSDNRNTLIVFPNPVQSVLTVQTEALQASDFIVEVYSVAGQLLFTQQYEQQTGKVQLDVSGLPSGYFLVKVTGEEVFFGSFFKG